MKLLKKAFALILVLATVTALCACGAEKGKYTVGICQIAVHDALDAATKGFEDALKEEFGDNIEFLYQNAQGDLNVCSTIVNDFVSKNVDLIMANATSPVQQAYNATQTIPILGTSVTEYGVALNISNFTGVTGFNVSGTSDLAPLDDTAQMILDWFPNTKKVGLLYCSAEANSVYQVNKVREYLEAKGIVCTEYKFADSNDVAQVTEKAAVDSDVIYIPTDNTAASCGETIRSVLLTQKTPAIAGEENACKSFGVAALSISYYEIGVKTGKMAAKILRGEEKIENMAIEYDPNPSKVYNKEICEALGITPLEGYKAIGE